MTIRKISGATSSIITKAQLVVGTPGIFKASVTRNQLLATVQTEIDIVKSALIAPRTIDHLLYDDEGSSRFLREFVLVGERIGIGQFKTFNDLVVMLDVTDLARLALGASARDTVNANEQTFFAVDKSLVDSFNPVEAISKGIQNAFIDALLPQTDRATLLPGKGINDSLTAHDQNLNFGYGFTYRDAFEALESKSLEPNKARFDAFDVTDARVTFLTGKNLSDIFGTVDLAGVFDGITYNAIMHREDVSTIYEYLAFAIDTKRAYLDNVLINSRPSLEPGLVKTDLILTDASITNKQIGVGRSDSFSFSELLKFNATTKYTDTFAHQDATAFNVDLVLIGRDNNVAIPSDATALQASLLKAEQIFAQQTQTYFNITKYLADAFAPISLATVSDGGTFFLDRQLSDFVTVTDLTLNFVFAAQRIDNFVANDVKTITIGKGLFDSAVIDQTKVSFSVAKTLADSFAALSLSTVFDGNIFSFGHYVNDTEIITDQQLNFVITSQRRFFDLLATTDAKSLEPNKGLFDFVLADESKALFASKLNVDTEEILDIKALYLQKSAEQDSQSIFDVGTQLYTFKDLFNTANVAEAKTFVINKDLDDASEAIEYFARKFDAIRGTRDGFVETFLTNSRTAITPGKASFDEIINQDLFNRIFLAARTLEDSTESLDRIFKLEQRNPAHAIIAADLGYEFNIVKGINDPVNMLDLTGTFDGSKYTISMDKTEDQPVYEYYRPKWRIRRRGRDGFLEEVVITDAFSINRLQEIDPLANYVYVHGDNGFRYTPSGGQHYYNGINGELFLFLVAPEWTTFDITLGRFEDQPTPDVFRRAVTFIRNPWHNDLIGGGSDGFANYQLMTDVSANSPYPAKVFTTFIPSPTKGDQYFTNVTSTEAIAKTTFLDAKAGASYTVINKTVDFVLGANKKIINPALQNSSVTVSRTARDRDFVGVFDSSMSYIYSAARPTNDLITIGYGDLTQRPRTGPTIFGQVVSGEGITFNITKSRFDFDVPGTTGALVVMGRGTSSVAYPERRSGDALDNPAFTITMRAHPSVLVTLSSEAVQAMSSSEGVFVGQRSWQGNTGGFRNAGDRQERLFYTLSKVADQNGLGSSTAFVVIGSDNGFRYTPSMSNTSETVKFTIVKAPGLQGAYDTSVVTFGNWQTLGDRTISSSELVTFNITKDRFDKDVAGTTGAVVTAGRNSSIASVAYPERRSGDKLDNAAFDFYKTAFAGSSVTWSVQLNTIDPNPDIEYFASSVTITYGPKDVDRIGMLDRFNLFYTVGRIFDQDFVTIGTDTGFRYQPTESALENTKFFVIKGLSDTVPMLDLTGIFDGLNSFVTIFKTESSTILDVSANSPYPARFMSKNIGVGNHNGTVDIFYIGVSSTATGIRTQPTESALENTKFTIVKAPGLQGAYDTSVVTVGNWQTAGDRTISSSELVTFNVGKFAKLYDGTTSRVVMGRGTSSETYPERRSGNALDNPAFAYFKTAKAGSSVTWSIQVNTIDPNPDVEYQQSSITISYGPSDTDAIGSLDRFFLTLATRRTFDLDFITIGGDRGLRYQQYENSSETVKFTVAKLAGNPTTTSISTSYNGSAQFNGASGGGGNLGANFVVPRTGPSYSGTELIFPGDFTVEGWFYPTTVTGERTLFVLGEATGVGYLVKHTDAQLNGRLFGGTVYNWNNVTVNTWHHIAIVRSGTTITCYFNGVANSSTDTQAGTIGTGYMRIGGQGSLVTDAFSGNITNFRVSNAAIYTSNFTPPTTQLTATSSTQLLMLTESSATLNADSSQNNFNILNNRVVFSTISTPLATITTSVAVYSNTHPVIIGRGTTNETYPERRSGDSLDNPTFLFSLDAKVNSSSTFSYSVSGVTVLGRDRDRLFVGQQSWQGNVLGFRNSGDGQERLSYLFSKTADSLAPAFVAVGLSSTATNIRTQPTESSLENIRFTVVKAPGLQGAYDTSVVTIGNWQNGLDGRAVSSSELVSFNIAKLALQGVDYSWAFGATTSQTRGARGDLAYVGDPSFAGRSRLSNSQFERIGIDFFKTAFAGSSVTWTVQLNTIDPNPDIEYQASSVTLTYGPKDMDMVGMLDRFNLFYQITRRPEDFVTIGTDTGFRYQPTESSLEWTRFFFNKGLADTVPMLDLTGIFDGLNSNITIQKQETTIIGFGSSTGIKVSGSQLERIPFSFFKTTGIGGAGSANTVVTIGGDNGRRFQPSESSLENTKFTFIKTPGTSFGYYDPTVAIIGFGDLVERPRIGRLSGLGFFGDEFVGESTKFDITKLALQGVNNTWSGFINNSSFATTAGARGERIYAGDPLQGVYPLRRSGNQAENVAINYFKTAKAGSSVTWSIKLNTIDSDPDFEWRDSSVTQVYGPSDVDAIGIWDRWWMAFGASRSPIDTITIGTDNGFRYQQYENSSETVKFTFTKSKFDFDVPGTTGALVTIGDDITFVGGRGFYDAVTISDNSANSPYPAKFLIKTTGLGGAGSANTVAIIGSGVDDRLAYGTEKTTFAINKGRVDFDVPGTTGGVVTIGWGDAVERPRTGITYGGFLGDTISGEATTFNITKLADQSVNNTWSGYINSSSFSTTAADNGERVYVGDPFRGVHPLRRSGAQAENVSVQYSKIAKIGRVQNATLQFIDGNNGYVSGLATTFNTSDTDIVGVFSGIIDVRTFIRNPWIADYDGIPGALDAYATPDERDFKLLSKRIYRDDGSMGTDNVVVGTALVGRNSSNLLTYSEQITTSNGAWIITNGGINITTDDTTYVNPLGGATGVTRLSPTLANSYIGQEVTSNVVAGMPHSFSIWAKTSGPTSGVGLYADIDGGAVSFTGSAFNFNGGWARYTISFVPTTTVGVRVFIGNATVWDQNEPIWVWGAQLSQTTTSIAYVATTSAPVLDIAPDHYAGDELENVNLLLNLRAKRSVGGTLLLNTIDPSPDVEYQQSSVAVTVNSWDLDAVGTLDYFSIYYMLYRQFDDYLTIGSGVDSRLGYAAEKASFVFTKLLGQFGDNEAPILDLAGVFDGNIFSAILSKADTQIIGSGQTSQTFPARMKSGANEIVGFDFSKTTGIGGAGSSNTVATVGRSTDGRLGSAVEKAYFTVTTTLGNARETSVQTQAIAGSGVDDRLGYANEKTFFTVSKARFDRDVAGTTGALVVMGRGVSSATYPERRSGDQLDTAAFLYGLRANRGTSGTVTLKLIDPTDGNGFNSSAAVTYQDWDYDVVGSIDFMSAIVATGRSVNDFITIGTDNGFRYQQYQNSSETVKFTVGKFAKEYDSTTSYVQIGWGDLVERPRTGPTIFGQVVSGEGMTFAITKLAKEYNGTTANIIMGRGLTSVAYPERRSGDSLDNPAFDFAKTAQFLGPATLAEFSEPFSIGETGVTVTAVRNDSTIDPVFVGSLGYYPVADILANSSTTSVWIQQTQQSGYTQGTTYNFSIYMRQPVAASNSITFDIGYTSLAVITTTTSFTVSNSWSRYNFNFVAPRSSLTVRIRTTNTTRRDSLEVFGAQITAGTSPQNYVKTTTVGSASNLILQSEDFNSATWVKSSNTIVYGNITRGPEELGTVDWARPGDSQEELYYTVGKKADSDGQGSSLAFVTIGAGDNYGFRYQQYENSSETVKFTVGKFAKEYDGTTSYVMMGRGVTTAAYPERQQPTQSSLENAFFDITLTAKRGVAGSTLVNTIDSNPDIEYRVSSVAVTKGSWQPDDVGTLDSFNLFYQITRTFDTDTVTIGTDNGFRYQPSENSSETVRFLIGKNFGRFGGHPFDAAITGEGSTMLDLTNVFDGLVYDNVMLKRENLTIAFGSSIGVKVAGSQLERIPFDIFIDAKANSSSVFSYTVSGTTVRGRDRDRLFVGQQSWQGNAGGFRNAGDSQERLFYTLGKTADPLPSYSYQPTGSGYTGNGGTATTSAQIVALYQNSSGTYFGPSGGGGGRNFPTPQWGGGAGAGVSGVNGTIQGGTGLVVITNVGSNISWVFSTAGLTSWTVPASVTSVNLAAYGAGGGGIGYFSAPQNNLGGGGGAYAGTDNVAVTPGQTLYISVATNNASLGTARGGSSNSSWVNIANANIAPTTSSDGVLAVSGENGLLDGQFYTAGGTSTLCHGAVKYSGGLAWVRLSDNAGTPGGGAAGPNGNGGNANSSTYVGGSANGGIGSSISIELQATTIWTKNVFVGNWNAEGDRTISSSETVKFTITKDKFDKDVAGTTGAIVTIGFGSSTGVRVSGSQLENTAYNFTMYGRRSGVSSLITLKTIDPINGNSFQSSNVNVQVWPNDFDLLGAIDYMEIILATARTQLDTITIGTDNGFRYTPSMANTSETVKFTISKVANEYFGGTSFVTIGYGDLTERPRTGPTIIGNVVSGEGVTFNVTKSRVDSSAGTTGSVVTLGFGSSTGVKVAGSQLERIPFTISLDAKVNSSSVFSYTVSGTTVRGRDRDAVFVGQQPWQGNTAIRNAGDSQERIYYTLARGRVDFDVPGASGAVVTVGSDTGFRYQQYENSSETVKFTFNKLAEDYDGASSRVVLGRGTTSVAFPERRSGDDLDNVAFDYVKTAKRGTSGNVTLNTIDPNPDVEFFVSSVTISRGNWELDEVGMLDRFNLFYVVTRAFDQDLVTIGSDTGFRYQSSQNTSETVKFTIGKNFGRFGGHPFDAAITGEGSTMLDITDLYDGLVYNTTMLKRDPVTIGRGTTTGTYPEKRSGQTDEIAKFDFFLDAKLNGFNTSVTYTVSSTTLTARDRDRVFVGQQPWQGNTAIRNAGDRQERISFITAKSADQDGLGSSISFVTIGAGDNYGFRYQASENTSETVKFNITKTKFDFDVPGTTGAIVTIDSMDYPLFNLDAKQGRLTTVSGTTVQARDRDRIFIGHQTWQGNAGGVRTAGDTLETIVINLYKDHYETLITPDRPFLYNQRGAINDDLTMLGDGLEFMNVSFQSPKIDFAEITDLLVINVVFPVRVFDTSGDLDLNGNINTVASYGNLRMTDYADIAYFDDDYVGEKRSFT